MLSMDEVTEQYLLMSDVGNETKMNQNDSELDFQQLLKKIDKGKNTVELCSSLLTSSTVVDHNNIIDLERNDCQTLLKTKLDVECVAFAMTWGSGPSDIGPQTSDPPQLGLLPTIKECGPAGAPSMPQKPVVTAIRSTTSGSFDKEEAYQGEGDNNPSNAKRVKRMLQNRESAKRSRYRKIAENTKLETQVSALRGDKSSLMKRLSDVSQKYNDSVVDNRILNADFETIKAKVKAAGERCLRLTGSIPAFNAMPMSEASSMGMSLLDGSPSELSADAYVPVQEDPNNFFFQPTFNNPMSSHDIRRVNNGLGGIISSVDSVQKNTAT